METPPNPNPPLLDYAAAPEPAGLLARQPLWVICALAILLPGVSSFFIRERRRARCLLLLPIIPLAFLFFGPFWGEILFAGQPNLKGAGLYPFLATCLLTAASSLLLTIRDHARASGPTLIGANG